MLGYSQGRKLRTSVVYARHELTAKLGQTMGYERPLYFLHSDGNESEEEQAVVTSPDNCKLSFVLQFMLPRGVVMLCYIML
jgi:hypothetical protein